MAIAYDNSSQATGSTSSGTTFTSSITIGSGSNRVLIICVGLQGGPITGVTAGGTSMSLLCSQSTYSLWYLANPTSGSINIVASGLSTFILAGITAVSYTGASQTTPSNTNTISSSSTSLNISITTTVANSWIVGHIAQIGGNYNAGPTFGNDRIAGAAPNQDYGMDNSTTTTGSYTIGMNTSPFTQTYYGLVCELAVSVAAYTLNVSDTITLVETLKRGIIVKYTEIFTLLEVLKRTITIKYTEAITLVDVLKRGITIKYSEVFTLVDHLKNAITIKYYDNITLLDKMLWKWILSFNEIFQFSDLFKFFQERWKYLRAYLNDPITIEQSTSPPENPIQTYEDTDYIKKYL